MSFLSLDVTLDDFVYMAQAMPDRFHDPVISKIKMQTNACRGELKAYARQNALQSFEDTKYRLRLRDAKLANAYHSICDILLADENASFPEHYWKFWYDPLFASAVRNALESTLISRATADLLASTPAFDFEHMIDICFARQHCAFLDPGELVMNVFCNVNTNNAGQLCDFSFVHSVIPQTKMELQMYYLGANQGFVVHRQTKKNTITQVHPNLDVFSNTWSDVLLFVEHNWDKFGAV